MDRTLSDGRSLLSAGAQTEGNASLMGKLRCLYEHHGRRKSYGYKKLFWVVNEAKNCLEVYKNDQVYIPTDTIKADELRNVTYAADKQNRFYVMVVQLRRDYDVKFRMNSPEERDKWAAAINHLIVTFSITNQRKTMLGQVVRHVAIASRQLGIQIAVDTGMILTEIPDDLVQYVVEAVDTALNTIAVIAHSGERGVPRHYTLEVRFVSDISAWDQRSTYDPTTRSVLLQVGLYRDVLNHVQFCCTEPDDVLLMMQSAVYRNPTIEGWLDNDLGCVRGRRALSQYISRDPPLTVSLQFSQNVRDSTKVEAYLRRFVSEGFFEALMEAIRATVEEMVGCVERLRGNIPGTGPTAGASPPGVNTGGGSQPLMPRTMSSASFFDPSSPGSASPSRQPTATMAGGRLNYTSRGSGGVAAAATHSRSRSGGGAVAAATTAATGAGGGGGHVHNRSTSTIGIFYRGGASFAGPSPSTEPSSPTMSATSRMALNLLFETIDGLSVLLEANRVDLCQDPPTVVLTYGPSYSKKYRAAMLLESKFMDAFPESGLGILNTRCTQLKDQLHQLGLRVLLTQLLHTLKARLSAVCSRKKICVRFQWASLFQALRHVVGTHGDVHDRSELLRVVAGVMELYELRLLQLVQQLNDIPFSQTELGSASDNTASFFSLFCSCVWCINVVFTPFGPKHVSGTESTDPPHPTIVDGIMTDTIFVTPEDLVARVSAHLAQQSDNSLSATMRTPAPTTAVTISSDSPQRPNAVLLPAVSKLGKWCASYLQQRENIIPYDPDQARLLDVDSDSDNGSDDNASDAAADLDFGEAVATERSAENTFLSLQRVVNSVYDQQGPSVDLKISVQDIYEATRSLQNALDKKHRISKHDTEHIMTANLHRLRRMYTAVLDDEVGLRFLNEAEAEGLLKSFCEYEENEEGILERLRGAPVSDRVQATTGCDPSSTGGDVGQYDFVAVTRVALNDLLPREALVSRKAWRNGFLFGLTNTGKSLITNCLRGISRPTVATVGLARQVVCFKEWVLALHELGGRDSFRTNWEFYARRLPKVEFLIFVLDAMNHHAFAEARQYLHEVASEYPTKPLLIILNNYREHPFPMPIDELLGSVSLSAVRKKNPDRKVIVCTTDLTIVHSVNRTVPAKLFNGMSQLCQVLLARSPPDKIPSTPKPDPPPQEQDERRHNSPGSRPASSHARHQRVPTSGGTRVIRVHSGLRGPLASEASYDPLSQSPLTHDATKPVFASSSGSRQQSAWRGGGTAGTSSATRNVARRRGDSDVAAGGGSPSARPPFPAAYSQSYAGSSAPTATSDAASELSAMKPFRLDQPEPAKARPATDDTPASSRGLGERMATEQYEQPAPPHDVARGASDTFLLDHEGLNATAPTLDVGQPPHRGGTPSTPPLMSSATSAASLSMPSVVSASSVLPVGNLARTRADRAATPLSRTAVDVPSAAAWQHAQDERHRQSVSATQPPDMLLNATDSATKRDSPNPVRQTGPPSSLGAGEATHHTAAAPRRLVGDGASPSPSRAGASQSKPNARPHPSDNVEPEGPTLVCTPAPVLEDRPSVVRLRSVTVAPSHASPSPNRRAYEPLHLHPATPSSKWSSPDVDG